MRLDLLLLLMSLELGLVLTAPRPCVSGAALALPGAVGVGMGLKAWKRCMAAPHTALRVLRSTSSWQSVTCTFVGLHNV